MQCAGEIRVNNGSAILKLQLKKRPQKEMSETSLAPPTLKDSMLYRSVYGGYDGSLNHEHVCFRSFYTWSWEKALGVYVLSPLH